MALLHGPYSHSRLAMWRACPHQFWLAYVKGIQRADSPQLRVGGAWHAAWAAYVRHLLETGQATDLAQARRIGEGGVTVYEQERDIRLTPDEREDVEDLVEEFAGEWMLAAEGEVEIEQQHAWTEEWEPTGWNDEDAFFRGVIDYLEVEEPVATILDWKTSRGLPAPSTVAGDLQLPTYAGVVCATRPEIEEVEVSLVYPRFGGAVRSRTIYRDEALDMIERIAGEIAKIEAAEEFPAAPELERCGMCGVRGHCEAYEKAKAAEGWSVPETVEEAVALARRREVMRQSASEMTKPLKGAVETWGPLNMGDGSTLDHHVIEKEAVQDLEDFVTCLIGRGVDRERIWSALSIGKTELGRLLREVDRDVEDEIRSEHVLTTKGARFEVKRKAEED